MQADTRHMCCPAFCCSPLATVLKRKLTEACSLGFVEEMRFVAMRLHTKDQAPKEGQRESAEKAWKQVQACCFPDLLSSACKACWWLCCVTCMSHEVSHAWCCSGNPRGKATCAS